MSHFIYCTIGPVNCTLGLLWILHQEHSYAYLCIAGKLPISPFGMFLGMELPTHALSPGVLKFYLVHSLFFYCFIIHMGIQGLGPFSPLPPPPPLPPTPPPLSPPTPSIPSRNYFALISNFVEERV
jgi:hypothetical protein